MYVCMYVWINGLLLFDKNVCIYLSMYVCNSLYFDKNPGRSASGLVRSGLLQQRGGEDNLRHRSLPADELVSITLLLLRLWWLYVCSMYSMYVCNVCILYVCILYVCNVCILYVWVYVCTVCMYLYVCMYVCICIRVYMYVCMYVCISDSMYMYSCIYVCMYVRMYVCMYKLEELFIWLIYV